ncbi:MAG TPA: HPr family phosphocarrier protein [Burkholderiales bacterium]|nr:HPr family phosphocarrier protein [Burkholderiales bacterium]
MLQREVEIINKLGLHARASAKLTQVAGSFKANVWISRNGRRVNAKSIMGVMMLAAAKGSMVLIETDGADEADAMSAVVGLIAARFEEAE